MTSFNQFLLFIKKKFGLNVFFKYNHCKNFNLISSGILALDLILGVGGIPSNRVVEIYGPESAGKTTLSLHIIKSARTMKNKIVYIDMEHSLDYRFIKSLGINAIDFILVKPEFGEEALNIVEIFIKSSFINLIVIDSVAALVPKSEFTNNFSVSTIGLQARLMGQAMRKLVPLLEKYNCTLIFINQIREKLNTFFSSNSESTPGGRALKFFSSVRLELRKTLNLKGFNNNIIGNCITIKTIKNKLSCPLKACTVNFFFKGLKLSSLDFIVNCSLQNNILKKLKSKVYLRSIFVGYNQTNIRKFLKLNLNVLDKITFLLKRCID
jgi:recombination protein RecA